MIDKSICTESSLIEFEKIKQFSKIDRDYNNQHPQLDRFINYHARLEEFGKVIRDKSHDKTNRPLLTSEILRQYDNLELLSSENKSLIEKLLDPNTYTIITAHQPILFTGPLYVIYKAISAIKLAEEVSKFYPDYRIIPVFIIGGEDHDFEEINHTSVFGNTLTWNEKSEGPVGRLETESLYAVLKELEDILGEDKVASEYFKIIQDAYQSNRNFAGATQEILIKLLGELGLIVAQTDNREFKKAFIPFIEKEIFKQVSHPLVEETQEKLHSLNYTAQAFPRKINFFYLPQEGKYSGGRFRIERVQDKYKILNTDISFTAKEMSEQIHNSPERFSPNVVMRPIFQEFLFPNLAYVGGGGEIAYWLERKTQFEAFEINFPMLVRRDSAILIDEYSSKQLESIPYLIEDLDERQDVLIKKYAQELESEATELEDESELLKKLIKLLELKAEIVDPSLKSYVRSRERDFLNILDNIQHKIINASKLKHEIQMNRIGKLKSEIFPNENLQERKVNFLDFAVRYDKIFFNALKNHFNPLDPKVKVIKFKEC